MNGQNTAKSLEQRIDLLERTNRRYRFSFLGLSLVVLCLGVVAARPDIPEVIQAKKFEVLDDAGKSVIVAEASRDGGGRISVLNPGGLRVLSAYCTKEGNGELSVADSRGLQAISARGTADGGRFGVFNLGGTPMMEVTMEDNMGVIYTYGADGTPTGRMPSAGKTTGAGRIKKKTGK